MNYVFDSRDSVPAITLSEWLSHKKDTQPPPPAKVVVVPPDYKLCEKAILDTAIDNVRAHETTRKLKILLPHCDKCGSRLEVFQVPYIENCKYFICAICDEKLFSLLDRFPCGCPETGFRHNTLDLLFAQVVIDAFFTKEA